MATWQIKTEASHTMFGKRTGQHTASLVSDDGTHALRVTEDTAVAAKQALLASLAAEITNSSIRYRWCADGTLIVIYFRCGSWQYDILHAGSNQASGCVTNCETFSAIERQAAAHAEQSYGGFVRK